MMEMILLLMALAAVELAVLAGAMVWRTVFGGRERKGPEDSGTEENEDFEKRWRDGMRAMMGYDAETARRAARRDENEE